MGTPETVAKLRRFGAVELQQIQGHGVERGLNCCGIGIHEQADDLDQRRQGRAYLGRGPGADAAGTPGHEHQADGIHTQIGGDAGIFGTGDTAELDACSIAHSVCSAGSANSAG